MNSEQQPWTDDEFPWVNAEMNSNTQLGIAARIISRWGKDWHKEGRDEATYQSAHNDIEDLADALTKQLAELERERNASRINDANLTGDLALAQDELAAVRAEARWEPVSDGDIQAAAKSVFMSSIEPPADERSWRVCRLVPGQDTQPTGERSE